MFIFPVEFEVKLEESEWMWLSQLDLLGLIMMWWIIIRRVWAGD